MASRSLLVKGGARWLSLFPACRLRGTGAVDTYAVLIDRSSRVRSVIRAFCVSLVSPSMGEFENRAYDVICFLKEAADLVQVVFDSQDWRGILLLQTDVEVWGNVRHG